MTHPSDDVPFSRRRWLQSSAALGAAVVVPGCASGPAPRGPVPAPPRRRPDGPHDVLIVGGGPAGLSAALALGRARKRVLLCDAGPPRNAAASEVHNFLSRDGVPPAELRRVARAQLAAYPDVEIRDARVESIEGERGAFRAVLADARVDARRVLICTGMIDEMLPLEGFREHWGRAVFQCPYCHGWEARDRPWGFLVLGDPGGHVLPFALQLPAWTDEVTLFTGGEGGIPDEARGALDRAGVRVEERPIARLVGDGRRLEAVELADGGRVACEALFAHPPQRQVELVRRLGLELDAHGFVVADPRTRETSTPGVYAAGDLTTRMQAAVAAAATGMQAGAVLNMDLMFERAGAAP